MNFDLPTAQAYAHSGQIETWVHAYLTSGDWANVPFSQGLKQQPRWWRGPLWLPLASLTRVVGPEPEMEYCIPAASWHDRTQHIAASHPQPHELPPLIAEYRAGGELSLRDGNHRHGAMQLLGWSHCWVLIWYNSETEYTQDTWRVKNL